MREVIYALVAFVVYTTMIGIYAATLREDQLLNRCKEGEVFLLNRTAVECKVVREYK